ncbi:hypothetical protein CIHG_03178 [Coccidioides immitis H538.4]|uniref:Uncharacterized protein n=1 Tax=Coccidioides immitis H538.4 TaxID=396776 RepID=A0A0J8RL81_COCIT|nr:hypothetical protein CIHG_03178 [Coccidioides immitis H538.4]
MLQVFSCRMVSALSLLEHLSSADPPSPSTFRSSYPSRSRCAFSQAYHAAEKAHDQFRKLHKNIKNRLYLLCPTDNAIRFQEHCSAINRLQAWGRDGIEYSRRFEIGQTLAPAAKIPSFTLKFHVEESAYKAYQERHQTTRDAFFRGALAYWKECKRHCELLLHRSTISVMDKEMCWDWWRKFLAEVTKWEARVDDLVVPDWPIVLEELTSLVEERADLEDEFL